MACSFTFSGDLCLMTWEGFPAQPVSELTTADRERGLKGFEAGREPPLRADSRYQL
jgi:hypothetical protein